MEGSQAGLGMGMSGTMIDFSSEIGWKVRELTRKE